MVLTFCGETGEPIQHGLRLLDVGEQDLRVWALDRLKDRRAKATLSKLISSARSATLFDKYAGSTASRLSAFEESKALYRFCGLPASVGIRDIVRQNAVLLVKAAPSPWLSPPAARTYLALLMAGFLHASMENARDPIPHFLFCDEAYEYVTKDAAALLDLTVKCGLRVTLIHHHNLQFKDEGLRMSLEQNAAIKYIFDGLPVAEKKRYAEEFWLQEANTPEVMETKDRLVNLYYEADYVTQTPSGEVMGTRYVPDQQWVEDKVYYTRDQQVAMLAGRFMLPVGVCVLKLPYEAFRCELTETDSYAQWTNPDDLVEFEKACPLSITTHDADQKLAEQDARFAERSASVASPRAKKRPPSLHPQS
jgi:hypothetical protein